MFDIFIIGGGINGSGIARDAAGRGYKVGLAEQYDFGSQTSSWSTKLIHGGIRYLENYEFSLVKESLNEREVIYQIANHISKPLNFILPHVPDLRPSWLIRIGLFLYDFLAGRSVFPKSKRLDLLKENLKFLSKNYQYGYQYADLQIDDSRLTLLNILDSENNGAQVFNYTKVTSVDKKDDHWEIGLSNGKKFLSKILINATGPMIEGAFRDIFKREVGNSIRLIQGSHIITNKLYEEDKAYILQQPDKRIVFVIPYLEKFSLIGTTEIEVSSAINPKITPQEKKYLIECVNRFSDKKIQEQDILWSYSGVRPLIQDSSESITKNSRDYHLDNQLNSERLIHIYGGKLTTYRKLSEKTVDYIDAFFHKKLHHWTGHKKLPGSENNSKTGFKYKIEKETLNRITKNYGGLSDKVFECMDDLGGTGSKICDNLYEFEILYLIKFEHAKNEDDILFRRTKLGIQFNSEEIRNKIHTIINNYLN